MFDQVRRIGTDPMLHISLPKQKKNSEVFSEDTLIQIKENLLKKSSKISLGDLSNLKKDHRNLDQPKLSERPADKAAYKYGKAGSNLSEVQSAKIKFDSKAINIRSKESPTESSKSESSKSKSKH